MTRKDYELIAKSLKQAIEAATSDFSGEGAILAARYLALDLAVDNPRFDKERFLRACGVEV